MNVISILIDDLGWVDLSCQGSGFYETPHIDRLAKEGLRFTEGYAAAPVCSPSRASLLTGKCPARIGVTDWIGAGARGRLIDAPNKDHLPTDEITLAKALRDHGYTTWHVGKWHLGGEGSLPQDHGFDVNIGGHHFGYPVNGYFSPWKIPSLEDREDGEYLTDRLTDEAIQLMHDRDADRPFFLNLCYYAVHVPIEAKAELIEKYEAKARRMGLDKVDPLVEGEFYPCEHKKDQRVTRRVVQSDPVYAAMIETLDTNIGRLLDALDALGLAAETLVTFTSDNGGLATSEGSPTCNAPLSEGKGWTREGGDRVPWIARCPGLIREGIVSREPIYSPDLYPTLLELCGLPLLPDQHRDGISFAQHLTSGESIPERPLFFHYPHYGNQGGTPSAAVRLGCYKLIELFETGELLLFDLEVDIGETRDLSPKHPELTRHLHRLMLDWRKETGALLPERNPAFIS